MRNNPKARIYLESLEEMGCTVELSTVKWNATGTNIWDMW